jgi:tRNA (cmo5U34)-methyltransferase
MVINRMKPPTDSIYAEPLDLIAAFKFDEKVTRVFADMIQRSVPGYGTIISAIGLLAKQYAQQDSRCYDLGCSLGAATLTMASQIETTGCRIVAIDNSEAMIANLKDGLRGLDLNTPVEIQCADIRDTVIEDASIVVLNFTLQFIPVADRGGLLRTIYRGLRPGGILILSEKLKFTDQAQESLHVAMHHLFKQANGYSALEISQKRSALDNVLIPETLNDHKNRLAKAGFSSAEVWFQYFNFASLIALK